ncbi:hypothetical protein KKA23_00485 [Patescibacteria group bacterium]|nr:hypothetical protein [Patescibacteria group bacterium]
MKKQYIVLIIFLIFIISILVRYWPIYHKGFSWNIDATNLILARNLSLTGEYMIVDKMDIALSSELIKERGINYSSSNKLTPILYSKIFNVFGFNPQIPLYVSLVIYGITTVLLFLLILKLFNIRIALIFAGVDIFLPFILSGSNWFGFYEWAMLFFVVGISIYLWKEKPNIWRLLFSGLFFGLASLARNAFLISFIPFLFYDFYSNFIYKKEWRPIKQLLWLITKRIFVFILPVVLLWGGFMFQDYFSGIENSYITKTEMAWDGHLFTDPYTYHFEKDEFIKEKIDTAEGDEINALIGYGYIHSLKARIKMHFISFKYYITGFFRQPLMGGLFVILFLVLGSIFLHKRNKKLFNLSILWIVFLFLVLISLRTSNEDHFLEIRFPLVLLISLGVFWVIDWLRQIIQSRRNYLLLAGAILLVFFGHLIQSNKWMFHENYLYSGIQEKIILMNMIKENFSSINTEDIIVVPRDYLFLNYYTNYNYIYFDPKTIKRLLGENKLQWAFNKFGVTHIAGFDELLSKEILSATEIKIID